MLDIYKQEDIEKIAQDVVDSVAENIKENVLDAVHDEISGYLYEHYVNNKNKVEAELIKSITEEFVKNPNDYKFADLRKKMFFENKEVLSSALTDEGIKNSIEDVIEKYTHRNYHFEWKWKDGIARFILENFDKFKDDSRVNEWIGRQLKMKDSRIAYLEEELNKIREITN